jgi:competence protein ComEA
VLGIGDKRAAKLSAEGLTVNGEAFKGAAKAPARNADAMAAKAPVSAKAAKSETKQ